ncbi:MAG: zinc ribbon domain-containing protein [Lachnospiraceae bacterium]|nr:zinc ribbon domain-containing protein [Lachnospiraceae bacterium]
MKCPSCGANLQIDHAFCPYCGKANPVAQKHREDMKRYANDYKKTKEEVIGNTRKFNKITFRITAIAITLAAIAGVIVLSVSQSRLSYNVYREKRSLNAPQYYEEVMRLIEEEDYIGLDALASAKGVRSYGGKELKDYSGVFRASECYSEVFQKLMACLSDLNISDSDITSLASNIYRFYKSFDSYSDYGKDNELVIKFNADIQSDMKLLLSTYLGISKETAEKVGTMSEGQISVMIEEVFREKDSEK